MSAILHGPWKGGASAAPSGFRHRGLPTSLSYCWGGGADSFLESPCLKMEINLRSGPFFFHSCGVAETAWLDRLLSPGESGGPAWARGAGSAARAGAAAADGVAVGPPKGKMALRTLASLLPRPIECGSVPSTNTSYVRTSLLLASATTAGEPIGAMTTPGGGSKETTLR